MRADQKKTHTHIAERKKRVSMKQRNEPKQCGKHSETIYLVGWPMVLYYIYEFWAFVCLCYDCLHMRARFDQQV